MRTEILIASIVLVVAGSTMAEAQAPADGAPRAAAVRPTRPPLFLKEDWQQIPGGGENPVTPASLTNANVEMKLYGASSAEIQLTGEAGNESNPVHVWTGLCTTPCGITLRDKTQLVDLTGLARIKWNTKTSGFHAIRPLVRLADGTLLVGDHTDDSMLDWLTTEFSLAAVRWLEADPERLVTTGNFVEAPDLSRVDEVGFVDLMPASGHGPGGWSDVAQMEIYGKAVARD
jgi:hypothetical protein